MTRAFPCSCHPILGITLLELTETSGGVLVKCPACNAEHFVVWGEEPVLCHRRECPVARAILDADLRFRLMSGSPWLA